MFQKRAIFINTASQVIVRFITLAFTLISIKLLANYLGPSGVGNFNTITTYINFFIVIADLGLFAVAVREISKKPEDEKKILSNVFFIRLISALTACFFAAGIVFLTKYNSDIKFGVLIACCFLFFNLLASVYDMLLQYRLKMQYSALAEFISKLGNIVILYLIIRLHGNFLWIISTIAIWGISIFMLKWYFSAKFQRFGLAYDRKISSWIFHMAWPLGLVFIVNNLFFKLDTILLFIIKGPEATGIYSVAYKVLEVTAFIGAFYASALKPTLAENIEQNNEHLKNIIQKSISVMIFFSLPITIVCSVFSKEIVVFLSNTDFISGGPALVLLAFTLPFIYLVTLLSEILIANDSRKAMTKISVFILLFNLLANLYFIPKYSFMGAAFTTLVSEILLFGIYLNHTKKIINFKINASFITKSVLIGTATIIAGFLLKTLDQYFLIPLFLTVGVFFFLSWMFKLISIASAKELMR